MTLQTDPAAPSVEQMRRALTDGARLSGDQGRQAAAFLLTATELPGGADFARHVETGQSPDPDTGARVATARVRSYPDLLADTEVYFTAGDKALTRLAAALAEGGAVDLGAALGDLDSVQVRRFQRAVAIATGLPQ